MLAAASGQGVAPARRSPAANDLAAGTLVQSVNSPKIRLFREWAKQEAATSGFMG